EALELAGELALADRGLLTRLRKLDVELGRLGAGLVDRRRRVPCRLLRLARKVLQGRAGLLQVFFERSDALLRRRARRPRLLHLGARFLGRFGARRHLGRQLALTLRFEPLQLGEALFEPRLLGPRLLGIAGELGLTHLGAGALLAELLLQ